MLNLTLTSTASEKYTHIAKNYCESESFIIGTINIASVKDTNKENALKKMQITLMQNKNCYCSNLFLLLH